MGDNVFIQEKSKFFPAVIMLLACVCAVVQMYAIPHRNTLLMMLSNRTMVVVWLAVAFGSVLINLNSAKPVMGIVAMLGLAVVAFLISFSGSLYYYETGLPALLNFIVLPLILVFFAFYGISDFIKRMLLFTNIALSVLFIYLSTTRMAYRFDGTFYTIYTGDLSLGYPNPNQAAMYLFACAVNLAVGFFYFEKKYMKAIFLADFIYMLVLLEKTKSRTALLLTAVFIVFIAVNKIPKMLLSWTVMVPLIYVLATQLLPSVVLDMEIMGENIFNGREAMFDDYFRNLDGFTLLFGDFWGYEFGNLHNAYLSIVATAGVGTLILYMRMLKKHVHENYVLGFDRFYERVAFFGFLCVILYSSTEAAGLLGGTNYAFMNLSVFAYFSKPFAKLDA